MGSKANTPKHFIINCQYFKDKYKYSKASRKKKGGVTLKRNQTASEFLMATVETRRQ